MVKLKWFNENSGIITNFQGIETKSASVAPVIIGLLLPLPLLPGVISSGH